MSCVGEFTNEDLIKLGEELQSKLHPGNHLGQLGLLEDITQHYPEYLTKF